MMGRIGISYDEVADVADKMVLQGNHPTVEKIREHLQTGSHSTILNHLRRWRQKPKPLAAPDSEVEHLVQFLSRLNQTNKHLKSTLRDVKKEIESLLGVSG